MAAATTGRGVGEFFMANSTLRYLGCEPNVRYLQLFVRTGFTFSMSLAILVARLIRSNAAARVSVLSSLDRVSMESLRWYPCHQR